MNNPYKIGTKAAYGWACENKASKEEKEKLLNAYLETLNKAELSKKDAKELNK